MRTFTVLILSALCIAVTELGAPANQPPKQPGSAPASAPASKPASAPSDGWVVAYSIDPNKAVKAERDWLIEEGAVVEFVKGSLVIKPKAADADNCHLMLKTPAFPRSVKVGFDATLEGDNISDIGVILNGDEKGYVNGYLLQFGGMGNSVTWLRRAGAKVEDTESQTTVTPGQKYHIVAQNMAGEVSLAIDGKEVFRHTDPEPLEGDGHGMIGLFTWAGKLTISKLVVYNRPGELTTQPATQPVDEKAVAALIRQLGDDNFKTREAATQALIAMGPAIHPILKVKAEEKGLDAEVVSRIQMVLKSKAPRQSRTGPASGASPRPISVQ